MPNPTEPIVEHTPGPWAAETRRWRNHMGFPQVSFGVRSSTDGPIADLSLIDATEEVAEANARLIAAAPDLLTALKAQLSYGMANREMAEAAIRKAEGRDS